MLDLVWSDKYKQKPLEQRGQPVDTQQITTIEQETYRLQTMGSSPLADRMWTCVCGETLDRDENAAINIKNVGLSMV